MEQEKPTTIDKIAAWFFGVLLFANVGLMLTDIAIDVKVGVEDAKKEKLNEQRTQLSQKLFDLGNNEYNMTSGYSYLTDKWPFEAPSKPDEEPTPVFYKVIEQMARERAAREMELGALRDSVKKLNRQRELYVEKTIELKKVYLSSKNK